MKEKSNRAFKLSDKFKIVSMDSKDKPVISLPMAAELINMDRSNFWRIVTERKKFTNEEAYQVGKLWLITTEGLKRVYGDRIKEIE